MTTAVESRKKKEDEESAVEEEVRRCAGRRVEGVMDARQPSYFTVVEKHSQRKFLCYTRRKSGILCVRLTDAADVWSTNYTEDTLNQFKQRFSLKSTEDYVLKLRSACGSGDVSIVVHDSGAELQVGSGPGDLSVTLSRLESPQATEELRELLFGMADSLTQLDIRSLPASPVKNHQWCPTEFEPRQQQNCASSMTVKRRLPGASLINPGTKKKLQATGVAFDDADED
ncbi:protein PAXX isoform X2 [Trachinotus anak]|uniref:protein PAXX isoform X2 n=1 Tax=Trachinotus anak TaxID=443729 RepID=UPI0039F24B75